MNLFEFEYSGSEDDDDFDIDSVNNFVKFLNNQHQMKRLTFFMDKVVFWDPIMKMTQLEFLELKISSKLSNKQILTILKNHTNTSVKFLKIIQKFNDSSFKLCQTIAEYFSGVVHLDLRWFFFLII